MLFLVAGAGPFAFETIVLVDLLALVGTDVFLLSLLFYFREALFGWVRPAYLRLRIRVEGWGLMWPDRSWFRSTQDFGRCITYNLDIMEIPIRVAACAMLLFAAAAIIERLLV
jgi:hypothetical protein